MNDTLFTFLFDAFWQSAILAGIVCGVILLMGSRLKPNWRYLLWCVVLLRFACPILPVSPWGIWQEQKPVPIPSVEIAMPMTPPIDVTPIVREPILQTEPFVPEISTENIAVVTPVVQEIPTISWTEMAKNGFLAVWFCGVIFFPCNRLVLTRFLKFATVSYSL